MTTAVRVVSSGICPFPLLAFRNRRLGVVLFQRSIVGAAKRSPLLALPCVVRCYDSIVLDHDQLAFQPPHLIDCLLELPFEGLNIFSSEEIRPSLDLSPNGLNKLDVVEPNATLGYSQDRMVCQMQGAHGLSLRTTMS